MSLVVYLYFMFTLNLRQQQSKHPEDYMHYSHLKPSNQGHC